MSRKAEFKARREMLGLSQADLAKMLGIDTMNVKRWERPGQAEPREFAFDLLDELESMQWTAVGEALSVVDEMQDETGSVPNMVQLTYYREQAQYDLFGRDEGLYNVANANARAVATILRERGINAKWAFPDDEENIYHGLSGAGESEQD